MARAKREIPHLYVSTSIDLTRSLAWLTTENQRRTVTERLLPVVLFIKAVARACTKVPGLNGFWTDHGFASGGGVHIGCAIALRGGGLVAPALHDVNVKTIDVVSHEFADLVKRARAGGLRSSEMSPPTTGLPMAETPGYSWPRSIEPFRRQSPYDTRGNSPGGREGPY